MKKRFGGGGRRRSTCWKRSPRRAASPRTRSTRLKTERLIVRRPAAAPRALAGADPADGPARARRSFLLCGSPFPSLLDYTVAPFLILLIIPSLPLRIVFSFPLSVRPPSNAIQFIEHQLQLSISLPVFSSVSFVAHVSVLPSFARLLADQVLDFSFSALPFCLFAKCFT